MSNSIGEYLPTTITLSDLLLKWTPRIIVATVAGYYSLGIAYRRGIMAEIDQIAIKILMPHVGYVGLGAIMPTFQWYAAWGVRMVAALAAGILYDLSERTVLYLLRTFFHKPEEDHFKAVETKVEANLPEEREKVQTGRKLLPA